MLSIKLKQGQKTAFPFPLRVSPCLAKGKHSSLPWTPIPYRFLSPTFCLPPETGPHSFICTLFYRYVYGFGFHSAFLFVFLWLFGKQFYKSVHYLVLSNFIGDIEYLLFVLLNSAVWIGYIVRCSYLCWLFSKHLTCAILSLLKILFGYSIFEKSMI